MLGDIMDYFEKYGEYECVNKDYREVSLYDIDYNAALDNEVIGNKICRGLANAAKWVYKAERDIYMHTLKFSCSFCLKISPINLRLITFFASNINVIRYTKRICLI